MTANTLRLLAGLPVGQPFVAEKTALLLIDYQNEYLDGALPLVGVEAALCEARRLQDAATEAGWQVIHIHHVGRPGSPFFAPGSPGVAPIAALSPAQGEAVVHKAWPSSFVQTPLAELLAQAGIDTLVVAGFMTHNCVDSTARDAFHRGLRVVVAADACATRDLPGADGTVVPAAVVQAGVLAGLGDRVAEVATVAGLLAWAAA
jgi:nicotinamidase-related amidase